MSYRGKFTPKNVEKYVGDASDIVFRSLWERTFMRWCDESRDVIKWSSETVTVPYRSPLDRGPHLYYVDFIVTTKDGITLFEIKPDEQCRPPKAGKRRTKKFETLMRQWLVNEAKWLAARKYAEQRGWGFRVLTEKDELLSCHDRSKVRHG